MATSNDLENTIKRYGLTEVFSPSNSNYVDIVFVHGLHGHPYHTWRSKENKIFWPAQLLPSVIEKDNARIWVYGYDAKVASFTDGASKDKIHNHAEQLVAVLYANRSKPEAKAHPIIFVAHSLGGLIVKRALIHSREINGNHTNHLRSIYVSTYGILFLGTPHKGSDISKWDSGLEDICGTSPPSPSIDTQSYLINALKANNETLQNIDRQFAQLTDRYHIFYFHEGEPTNIGGNWRYVVDEESASPNTADVERATIQQPHAHMCRFESKDAPGFDLLTEAIGRYAAEAPKIIRSRWENEISERRRGKRAQVEELLPGTIRDESQEVGNLDNQATGYKMPSTLATFHINAALGLQPKRHYIVGRQRVKDFFGREDELRQISSHFSAGSTQQPNILVLHALGGQGKSQIALEYCQRCRQQYCGTFWINASSEELALESYVQIAKALNVDSSAILRDRDEMIRLVRDNLECWSENWLLVFDNYDDPDNFKVHRLLPRSEHGHVLFTSRRKDLDRLGFLVEVPAMSSEDGVSLLLRGYNDKDIQDHFDTASKIIDRLGGLALAIDQAAAYIRYRRIALAELDEFLTIYDLQRKQILSYTPGPFWEYCKVPIHVGEARDQAINAFTTWEMSLEQLSSDRSIDMNNVTRFLTISAFLNPTEIEEWLFQNRWKTNQTQWLRALAVMNNRANNDDASDKNDECDRNARLRLDLWEER